MEPNPENSFRNARRRRPLISTLSLSLTRVQPHVTRILASSRNLEQAMPRMLDALGTSSDASFMAFWVVTPDDRLSCMEVWSPESEVPRTFERATWELTLAPGAGLPGRVCLTGEAAWIDDVERDPNHRRASDAATDGLAHAAAFPISLGGDQPVLGVVEAYWRFGRQPDHDTAMHEFSASCLQVARFVEHTRLQQHLEQVYAVEICEEVVSSLRLARQALNVGRNQQAERLIDETIEAAERIVVEADQFGGSVDQDADPPSGIVHT